MGWESKCCRGCEKKGVQCSETCSKPDKEAEQNEKALIEALEKNEALQDCNESLKGVIMSKDKYIEILETDHVAFKMRLQSCEERVKELEKNFNVYELVKSEDFIGENRKSKPSGGGKGAGNRDGDSGKKPSSGAPAAPETPEGSPEVRMYMGEEPIYEGPESGINPNLLKIFKEEAGAQCILCSRAGITRPATKRIWSQDKIVPLCDECAEKKEAKK